MFKGPLLFDTTHTTTVINYKIGDITLFLLNGFGLVAWDGYGFLVVSFSE